MAEHDRHENRRRPRGIGSPFIDASNAYFKVELLPLLSHHLHVTEITLKTSRGAHHRTEQGEFNVSTIGKKRGENEEPPPENPAHRRNRRRADYFRAWQ